MEARRKSRLGEQLTGLGLITPDQLRIALKEQRETKLPIGRQLVQLGFVTEAVVRDQLAHTIGKASVDLDKVVADAAALKFVPETFARRHVVLPIAFDAETQILTLAVSDQSNVVAPDQLRANLAAGIEIDTVVAGDAQLLEAIDRFYGFDLSVDGILKLSLIHI